MAMRPRFGSATAAEHLLCRDFDEGYGGSALRWVLLRLRCEWPESM